MTLDTPQYRHQRILYPVVARILALGNAQLIPWTLILTNLAAVTAIGYFAGLLAKELGDHSLFGLAIALFPGLLLSLSKDLAEPLSLALILASLIALRRSNSALATLLLGLAVLARETALLVAVAAGVVFLFARFFVRFNQPMAKVPWFYFTVPACIFVGWQVFLSRVWGGLPVLHGASGRDWDLPFKDIVQGYGLASADAIGTLWLLGAAYFLSLLFSALVALRHSEANLLEKVALVLYVAGILTLDESVWRSGWSFLRVGSEAAAFAFIVLLSSKSRLKLPVLAASAIAWAGLAVLAIPS